MRRQLRRSGMMPKASSSKASGAGGWVWHNLCQRQAYFTRSEMCCPPVGWRRHGTTRDREQAATALELAKQGGGGFLTSLPPAVTSFGKAGVSAWFTRRTWIPYGCPYFVGASGAV